MDWIVAKTISTFNKEEEDIYSQTLEVLKGEQNI